MTEEYALRVIRDTNLDWQLHPGGGFVAVMNGIIIRATSSSLTISKNFKNITIRKSRISLCKQSTSLEKLITEIANKAAAQCLEHDTNEYQENLKNELLKQLTGLNT